MLDDVLKRISWLGHDSFRIGGQPTIYFDPWKLKSFPPADIILISHDHFDHFSKDDVAKLCKADTVVVTTPVVAEQLTGGKAVQEQQHHPDRSERQGKELFPAKMLFQDENT